MEDGTVYNLGLSIGPAGPKYSIIHFPHTKKGIFYTFPNSASFANSGIFELAVLALPLF